MTESTRSTRLCVTLALLALAGLLGLGGCSSLGEDFAHAKLASPYLARRA